MCVISPNNRLVATNFAHCYAHKIKTGEDAIQSKVLSLKMVFEMQTYCSFGTGLHCSDIAILSQSCSMSASQTPSLDSAPLTGPHQSNAGTCLPGIHASQSDSLPLQQWRGSSEKRCANPKGCRWLLCCLQILQRKQGVVLLDHVWQPKLFRPPLCLNHKSGCAISMIRNVQSATTF